jgi:hypothetical protein
MRTNVHMHDESWFGESIELFENSIIFLVAKKNDASNYKEFLTKISIMMMRWM